MTRAQQFDWDETGKLSRTDKRNGFRLAAADGSFVTKVHTKDAKVNGQPRKKGQVKLTWEHMRDTSAYTYDIGLNKTYRTALLGIKANHLPNPSRQSRIEEEWGEDLYALSLEGIADDIDEDEFAIEEIDDVLTAEEAAQVASEEAEAKAKRQAEEDAHAEEVAVLAQVAKEAAEQKAAEALAASVEAATAAATAAAIAAGEDPVAAAAAAAAIAAENVHAQAAAAISAADAASVAEIEVAATAAAERVVSTAAAANAAAEYVVEVDAEAEEM
jgi:hypothetical protein